MVQCGIKESFTDGVRGRTSPDIVVSVKITHDDNTRNGRDGREKVVPVRVIEVTWVTVYRDDVNRICRSLDPNCNRLESTLDRVNRVDFSKWYPVFDGDDHPPRSTGGSIRANYTKIVEVEILFCGKPGF